VKHFLPRSIAPHYQRLGFYGMFILIALLWFGRRFLEWWMTPVYVVFSTALRIAMPYVVPSPWTSTL
jgi:hypothetical protein